MPTYRTRTELSSYIMESGSIVYPFLQSGENWILSEVHDRPDFYLSDNSDILRTRMSNLVGKCGLSMNQKKVDGIPFWQGTYYVRPGHTLVDGLSVLDEVIKEIERLYAQMLSLRGETYFGETVSDLWTISSSEEYVIADLTGDNEVFPCNLVDCGAFMTLLRNDKLWSAENMESSYWALSSSSISDTFGTAFSFEEIADSLLFFTDGLSMDLWAGYINQKTSVEEGAPLFSNYLKRTAATLQTTSNTIVYNSTNTTSPGSYLVDSNQNLDYIKSIKRLYLSNTKTNVVYIVTNKVRTPLYNAVDRASRLSSVADTVVYSYQGTQFDSRARGKVLVIEGVTFYSYFSVCAAADNKYGMVLVDNLGNLLYRTSTDGINWYIPDDGTGIIIAASTEIPNIDYPTIVGTSNGGLIVFYNMDFDNGTADRIHYAYSRDNGDTWVTPEYSTGTSLGIYGVFPFLVRRRNGTTYLAYHTDDSICARKIYIQV